MKRQLNTTLSLLLLAAKRVWNHRLLMLCLLIGLVTAVSILTSIPLYADAAQNRILQGELTEAGTTRPAFSFLWRYVGTWNGSLTQSAVQPVDTYLREQAANIIGLPAEQTIRHVSSDKMRLFAGSQSGFNENEPLLWSAVGFITGLEANVTLIEGEFPSEQAADGPVQVVVSSTLAEQLGIQVGEQYTLLTDKRQQIPVTVSGIWTPTDPTAPFWFYAPESFRDLLLTSEGQFWSGAAPQMTLPVGTAVWYLILDGRSVRPGTVTSLLNNIRIVESRVNALLNGAVLEASPVATLQRYSSSAGLLIFTLTLFSLPIIGLVFYFVILIAGMVVRRDQSEIAILRSRGITRRHITIIYLLEGVLLGTIGIGLGLLLGRWIARLMGRTQSFLDANVLWGYGRDLVTVISPTALLYAGLAVGLTLLALLLPALRAARFTIVSLREQQARDVSAPVWQRYFLDLFLLIPTGYGWYQLIRQNRVALLNNSSDPFSNPLLFLVPILFCLSLGLLALRFVPLILRGLAGIAILLPWTTLLITLRQLARATAQYMGPLLLLTFTLSLATFTSSMATTLDDHLNNQVYYETGADLNLQELGEDTAEPPTPQLGSDEQEEEDDEEEDEPRWLFLPVSVHLEVDGVKAAARVGDYKATANIGGSQQAGRILGIDRLDFAQVAFFRRDFASNESLGGVLNRLAVGRDYILVSRAFMQQNGLQVGDLLRLTVEAAGAFAQIDFVIAAPLDYFPTLYPQDGPFFVAHLDYLYEKLGAQFPYDVWLATQADASSAEIVQGVRDLGLNVISTADAQEKITEEQARPERQGLFGLLSVGFSAAAVLTVLGFLVFAVVSFQRRFIELGMLRAIGLSLGQMALYLAGEQITLILAGMGLGTVLGLGASYLFIPYFQVGQTARSLTPPFVVQIAWGQTSIIYVVFGAVFLLAVLVLILLLMRMKVFEAIKLGETV
ncbi:MAG: ABC transporter permease [Anaerolineaceae bacterium]|nr:ABC transporter permease [Anaerolineaceae bacterium]